MKTLTRDVVVDLWPVYSSGEASADTRALIEDFLRQDVEFGERLRTDDRAGLRPALVALPVDHERTTLLRIQKRRARQSMIINSLALLASAAMTAFYAWDLVPRWALTFATLEQPLPHAMQVAAGASAWILRLGLPLAVVLVPLTVLFRKRLRVPHFLQSGIALATATGIAVVVAQLCWLVLLNDASLAMESAYRAIQAVKP